MSAPNQWITVDLLGPSGRNVFVHSAGGMPVMKAFRRVESDLGFDGPTRQFFLTLIEALRADAPEPQTPAGLVARISRIEAPDSKLISAAIWLGDREPDPRPIYNAWVLDVAEMTTATAGDDVGLIGDDRAPGEARHIQHLFTYLNPDDIWSMVAGYWDVLHAADGDVLHRPWTLNVPGGPNHFQSSARVRVDGDSRILYGTSMNVAHRPDYQNNLSSLISFQGTTTLLLFESLTKTPFTSIGAGAPVSPDFYSQVLAQISLDSNAQLDIVVDGRRYAATVVELHSSLEQHGDPVAVMLRSVELA